MAEPKLNYEESLMIQKLQSLAAPDGTVSLEDIGTAFWAVAWDLELALIQQRPDKLEEAKQRFLTEMAPMFAGFLTPFGMRLRQPETAGPSA